MNKLVVLIAEAKPPSADVTYLNALSYRVESLEDLRAALDDFKCKVERDGFKILNALIYHPPVRVLLSIGGLQLVWNSTKRPPQVVRCDGGIENQKEQ